MLKEPTWTDGRIASLTQIRIDLKTTATIARRLGVAKNAVVGKAHRMELPPRPSPIVRNTITKPPGALPASARALPALPSGQPGRGPLSVGQGCACLLTRSASTRWTGASLRVWASTRPAA